MRTAIAVLLFLAGLAAGGVAGVMGANAVAEPPPTITCPGHPELDWKLQRVGE